MLRPETVLFGFIASKIDTFTTVQETLPKVLDYMKTNTLTFVDLNTLDFNTETQPTKLGLIS